jgi:hypothetical protein
MSLYAAITFFVILVIQAAESSWKWYTKYIAALGLIL